MTVQTYFWWLGIGNIELKREFLCFRIEVHRVVGERNRVIGESYFRVVIAIIEV